MKNYIVSDNALILLSLTILFVWTGIDSFANYAEQCRHEEEMNAAFANLVFPALED